MQEIPLREYQRKVLEEVKNVMDRNFVVVSMPTGSGKTFVEMALAKTFLNKGKVLVIEPTRFLCDQMARTWENYLNASVHYDPFCGRESTA
jgi:superfamily II DNA or RNA helicase